jgi:hypothetical protein
MADKNFGVKEINLVGSNGDPTIESPTPLYLNAPTVAISTNITVGGQVLSNVVVGSGYSVGIGTTTIRESLDVVGNIRFSGSLLQNGVPYSTGAATYWNNDGTGISTTSNVGIGTSASPSDKLTIAGSANITDIFCSFISGDASYAYSGSWDVDANGTTEYTFSGIGFTVSGTPNPVLYLARGRAYRFKNISGGSHPFEIRVSSGGTAYNDGVDSNGAASGDITFAIPFNAPNTLFYQCTSHSGMGNTIFIYPSI